MLQGELKHDPELRLAVECKLDTAYLEQDKVHYIYGEKGSSISGGVYFHPSETIPKMLILIFNPVNPTLVITKEE
jgi:hypothetical protein